MFTKYIYTDYSRNFHIHENPIFYSNHKKLVSTIFGINEYKWIHSNELKGADFFTVVFKPAADFLQTRSIWVPDN
jgi:hypothetical protein